MFGNTCTNAYRMDVLVVRQGVAWSWNTVINFILCTILTWCRLVPWYFTKCFAHS